MLQNIKCLLLISGSVSNASYGFRKERKWKAFYVDVVDVFRPEVWDWKDYSDSLTVY